MNRLIFGCGYLGERVAERWRDAGDMVFAVTRGARRAQELERLGCHAILADVTVPDTLTNLPPAETVLFAVGYDRAAAAGGADRSPPTIEEVYAGGLRNVLAALPSSVARVIYISSTGVYGPAGGDWVNEQTPPDPQREGGAASLAAEQVLAGHPLGARGILLRLAGIYGPGRIPFLDELRAGQPIAVPRTGYLNLIHVDDAVRAVLAADDVDLEQAAAGELPPLAYCVSDGQPVERAEFYGELARRIGAAPPRFVQPPPGSPRAARAAGNRRVSNQRLLRELAVRWEYPDYRAGLAAILS